MDYVTTPEALEALYGTPSEAALLKVARRLTPAYQAWIEASRFCILSTVGPGGTDASPRGDDGPVVRVMDPGTLALPDWKGNDRIDSLRNIVADGRVSLMFFISGASNVVRVNGQARVTADAALRESFARGGHLPRSVIVLVIEEVYAQCARAILRSRLWTAEHHARSLPSMGDILRELSEGRFDGAAYDSAWPERARTTMW
ncbi:pyridoxamine 5'-phosphate oxidase family protein [Plastorhodobacter daqingensis]|uniref:Pyridoxamine 5'-phosphate oxidase family protein n=1 Tax=Plastorhodobacter daqingensis TaxID=1387281 RepID=A0ABW2UEB9_9RHOB